MNTNRVLKITVGVLILLLLSVSVYFLYIKEDKASAPVSSTRTNPTVQTELVVTEKTSEDDPDLRVSQTYKAVINDQEIEVPVIAKTTAPSSAATGTSGNTASLRQEIDVTPIVNQLVPDWELGAGVGTRKNGDVYIPVSIQRNYEARKGIQVELHIDSKDQKIDGVEIQHKWRF